MSSGGVRAWRSSGVRTHAEDGRFPPTLGRGWSQPRPNALGRGPFQRLPLLQVVELLRLLEASGSQTGGCRHVLGGHGNRLLGCETRDAFKDGKWLQKCSRTRRTGCETDRPLPVPSSSLAGRAGFCGVGPRRILSSSWLNFWSPKSEAGGGGLGDLTTSIISCSSFRLSDFGSFSADGGAFRGIGPLPVAGRSASRCPPPYAAGVLLGVDGSVFGVTAGEGEASGLRKSVLSGVSCPGSALAQCSGRGWDGEVGTNW